jgi:hypothetical protein
LARQNDENQRASRRPDDRKRGEKDEKKDRRKEEKQNRLERICSQWNGKLKLLVLSSFHLYQLHAVRERDLQAASCTNNIKREKIVNQREVVRRLTNRVREAEEEPTKEEEQEKEKELLFELYKADLLRLFGVR